jgi:hypothetical protein
VENLRGSTGADFEANGHICRGGVAVGCGCFGGGRSSEESKARFLLIKGPFCFVFKNDTASAPLYAISLHNMTVEAGSSGTAIILREYDAHHEEHYMLSFAKADEATTCRSVVKQKAAEAQTEEVRKGLGHGHLLQKHASVRFAETVAMKKAKDQPDAPVSRDEILSNMTMTSVPL